MSDLILTIVAGAMCFILLATIVFWVVDAVQDAWGEYKHEVWLSGFREGVQRNAPPF